MLCSAIICCALASCKKNVDVELAEYTPLSKEAGDLSASAEWAYEMESGRLEKKIDSVEAISKSVPLSPLALVALGGAALSSPLYPELEGFESLDTSSIQGELFEMIKEFCLDTLQYSQAVEDFQKYQAALKESAASQEKQDDESAPKKDSSKLDAAFSKSSLFSLALFLSDSESAGVLKSFAIGRPFVGEELMEVPVRWQGTKKILYTNLYPVQEGESWKIQQIQIYKSEENDGSVKTDGD